MPEQAFNPRRIIDGVNIPMGVMMLDISHGAKILYGLLAKHNGSGLSQKKMANLLGVSEQHIQKHLIKELYKEKLIADDGRNPSSHEPTNYRFLFHEIFSSNIEEKDTRSIVRDGRHRGTRRILRDDNNIYYNNKTEDKELIKNLPSEGATPPSAERVHADKPDEQAKPSIRKIIKKQKVDPKMPVKDIGETPEILEMIDYWNSKKFPKLRKYNSKQMERMNQPTKRYIETVKFLKMFLRGNLYNSKYPVVIIPKEAENFEHKPRTVQDFKKFVDILEAKAFNVEYEPVRIMKDRLMKLTLTPFLVGNASLAHPPGLLLNCLTEPELSRSVAPKNKKLTEYLKICYQEMTHRRTNGVDHDKFIRAANIIQDFYFANRELLMNYGCREPSLFVDNYFVPALLESWGPHHIKKMRPDYFANPKALHEDVVNLMLDRRTISDRDELVIPN